MNTLPLEHVPLPLHAALERDWQEILAALEPAARDAVQARLAADAALAAALARVLGCSQFVAQAFARDSELLPGLLESGDLARSYEESEFRQRLALALPADADEARLATELRRLRRREMVRIVWRDLLRAADLVETTRELTWLAEATVEAAVAHGHAQLAARHGEPRGRESGAPQRLVVLGMGKLGACELNLSSDIDLIFAYPEQGETDGERALSNQEFFTRLGQRVIKAIDAKTQDGFVFRVDMRLRPYGDAGALALNFDAMEEYYQDQGRDWERYAMIKARVIAGDRAAGEQLLAALRPFTYRRYIDFSAIEALRGMKAMINREVQRRGKTTDVKLGAGGIREIEFIVQSFQLIRGGRETALQERRLLVVLELLGALGHLPADGGGAARRGLRVPAQHRARDPGSGRPADPGPARGRARQAAAGLRAGLARLVRLRGRTGAPPRARAAAFRRRGRRAAGATRRRAGSARCLARAVGDGEGTGAAAGAARGDRLRGSGGHARSAWVRCATPIACRPCRARGASASSASCRCCWRGRGHGASVAVIARTMALVESVLRRSAYLVLLEENPGALEQLVRLCSASPWIAQELANHPVLLDELIDPRALYTLPERATLAAELQQHMLRIPLDDLEAQMEALRYFKLAHRLRCAASEVTGALPLMKVSDYLSFLAETILGHVLAVAWHYLVERHGTPQKADGVPCDPDFIVVAYGKLGGIELAHGSDLDLVFIHDADPMLATDGERAIENGVFFTRLGQRIIHVLTAYTPLGQLYEVDMRLRPSGAAGLLVSSLTAFREYQYRQAWTWEHQALVRARPVAGCPRLAARFEELRREVLAQPRELPRLRAR
jgi:glutamate-ammonia-ligase adenylyltransferase